MNRGHKTLDIFCYALVLLVLTAKMCSAEEDFEAAQKRASGTVGLFPFPRVGRSDPDLAPDWDTYNSFENYDELGRHEMKRQGLVAFPRVGRSGSQRLYQQYSDYIKRGNMQGASPSTHLWFGPRIGKRSARDQENEIFTPRLGRSMKNHVTLRIPDYPLLKNAYLQAYNDDN